jgi:Stage II sporulation protein E (SpoIIE)
MQRFQKYSHIGLGILLVTGLTLAVVLCVQCTRTYIYIGSVLVPQQAEHEAERQVGALGTAARVAGVMDPHALGPLMERVVEASSSVLWMRLIDQDNKVLAQAGTPQGRSASIPPGWWERVEKHESLGRIVQTQSGKALVAMLPFRLPRPSPPHGAGPGMRPPDEPHDHPPQGRRPGALVLDIAIPLDSVAGAFDGLRRNIEVGLLAAVALLLSVMVIGIRTPSYIRGKYLERELELAKRVQNDLQPKPLPVSPSVDFAASAQAADHVGGDFHDVFETAAGKIAIVLGDVSGKGVPAALLVSVLHGAIRSSSGSQHETACERINRMLCERTASERYATLFWGVFDANSSTLRYVNAGHPAPMLLRSDGKSTERLNEGGPVLGVLASASYTAGVAQVETGDMLIVYSDGINEAANASEEEFGEKRIAEAAWAAARASPTEICNQIMTQVSAYSHKGSLADDRTLMVVRFLRSAAAMTA